MRSFKMFGALVAVFAFCAIGVASASASTFTASATGELEGAATNTQEFTTNAGTVRCSKAKTTGTITSTASTEQLVNVEYSGCSAFSGFVPVDNIKAEYKFESNGTVHIEKEIVVQVTGLSPCTIRVFSGQWLTSNTFTNSGSNMIVTSSISGITYQGSGGACGSEKLSNGTYKGTNEVHRVGGGSVSWDA